MNKVDNIVNLIVEEAMTRIHLRDDKSIVASMYDVMMDIHLSISKLMRDSKRRNK